MNTNTRNQVNWDFYAHCYDSLNHLIPYQELQRRVARNVLSHQGGRILDAACGTGNFEQSLRVCEKELGVEQLEVHAIDSSKEMLARAQEKHFRDKKIFFNNCNLNKTLPFEDEAFHQILSANTIYAVEDPRATMTEFYRVLRVGGIINVVTPKAGYENGLILKEHCGSKKPDSYWINAHQSPEREEKLLREAIHDTKIIDEMLAVARINRAISIDKSFYFFTEIKLIELFNSCGFTVLRKGLTYAQQGLFITAKKEE